MNNTNMNFNHRQSFGAAASIIFGTGLRRLGTRLLSVRQKHEGKDLANQLEDLKGI